MQKKKKSELNYESALFWFQFKLICPTVNININEPPNIHGII